MLIIEECEEAPEVLQEMCEQKLRINLANHFFRQLVDNLLITFILESVIWIVHPFICEERLYVRLHLVLYWIILIEFGHQREEAIQLVRIFYFTMKLLNFQNHVIKHSDDQPKDAIPEQNNGRADQSLEAVRRVVISEAHSRQ
jgi:hypothetical protein